jgi:hypothetical protein
VLACFFSQGAGSKLCRAHIQWRAAGELSFQGPTHFDLAINMKTAKALAVTIPPSLLVSAEVID